MTDVAATYLRYEENSKEKGHGTQSLDRDNNGACTCICHCKQGCHGDCDCKEEGICSHADQFGLSELQNVDLPVLQSEYAAYDGQE